MPHYYKVVSLLILLSFAVFQSESQMRTIYNEPPQFYNEIKKLSFYSPSKGYIATGSYIGYSADSGRTISQKNITWSNVNFNGFNNVNLTFGFGISGIKAFNEDTVIVYGDYGLVPAILISIDKGNTFRLLYHTYYDPSKKTNGITDMVFPENRNTGYAIDADMILKTYNRGVTWTPIYGQTNSYFEFLEAVDDNNVFAFSVENGNNLLKTSNGGLSWQPVSLPAGGLKYAHFISANKGWIVMKEGSVYYTSNGGINWSLKNDVSVNPLACTKMKFINDSTGYALDYSFTILKTTDSGKIWEPLPRENNYTYLGYTHNDLHFINDQQFWAGGSMYIELTTNGGGTPLPKAYFTIDTAGVAVTNQIRLINLSKPNYQYQWYRNDTLISTSYNASYTHSLYRELDTIKLIVSSGAYTDTATQTQYFIVPTPIPVPVITTVTPGSATAGTTIIISGFNFTGATAVSIGGVPVFSFTVVSSTSITAIVPEGGNGTIAITTSYGTATKSIFTLIEPNRPVITSFSPASAPAGSVLTINGKNFSNIPVNNIVTVGGVKATVLTASPTALTVTVPTGAVYKPVSVTTGGLTGLSNIPFVMSLAQSETITSGTFPLRVDSVADIGALYIASTDLDGDGKPDMVTGNFSSFNRVEIYRNTSVVDTVSFGQRTYVTLAEGYTLDRQVALGDIDGDGKTDLLTSNDYYGTGFYVFKNLSIPGQISFDTKQGIPGTNIGRNMVRDLNNDGRLDVIGVSSNRVIVYQNNSSGNTISFAEIGRINMGTYSDHGYIDAADFDGDGKTDIITNSPSGQMLVYRNTSVGSLIYFSLPVVTTLYASAYIFTAGDIDLDGKPDVAVAVPNEADATSDSLIILRNTSSPGSISFSQQRGLPAFPYAIRKIMINDLNGDGKPEIAGISHYAVPKIHIRENHSSPGSIVLGQPVAIESSKEIYLNGDLLDVDGDGKTDIVELGGKLSVFPNQTGTLAVRICSGSNTTFTSDQAGSTYQWQMNTGNGFKNIVNDGTTNGVTTATLTITNIPMLWNNYLFRCVVDGRFSKQFKTLLESSVTPAVTISVSDATVCAGSPAAFTATAINGGDSPIWQWQVNGQNAGNNSRQFSNSLGNNDYVSVILTSNSFCRPNEKDTSSIITVTVIPVVKPQVSVTADNLSICKGASVTFTATPVNEGTNPVYTWNVSGKTVSTGAGNTYTTNSLTGADLIYVQLTSSEKCASPAKVNSKDISITVKPVDPPSVTISATTPTAGCYGSIINFDAQALNPGSGPTYQWQVNGNNVSISASYFVTNSLKKGDRIQVILTSNSTCASTTTAASNTIVMQDIRDQVKPTITISGNTNVSPGQAINLQAVITSGGTSPSYLWEDSTAQRGSWAALYPGIGANQTYTPPVAAGKIRCRLTSNADCASPVTVYSTPLSYTVSTPTAIVPLSADNYSLQIYPNPVRNWLTIDTLKLLDQWETVEIMDMTGKQVLVQNIQYQTKVTIRTESLSQGMFIAVLRQKNGKGVFLKFLKM